MKKLATLLAVLALCVLLTACGAKEEKTADLTAVLAKFPTNEDMMSLTEEDMLDFYGIQAADMKQFAAAMNGTGIKCDEYALVEAVDADAAARVKIALDNRYQEKLNQMDGYLPDEYAIVKACSVEQNGNYVAMIVAENADELTKLYQESFK